MTFGTVHRFGRRSSNNLATCNQALIVIANRALELSPYDFSIIHGYRGKDIQNALFASGASSVEWPNSKHNKETDGGRPNSYAIDFAPYVNGSIPWNETHIFAVIAGCFFAAAKEYDVELRWGGDWDGDGNTKEHKLQDWGHVELNYA